MRLLARECVCACLCVSGKYYRKYHHSGAFLTVSVAEIKGGGGGGGRRGGGGGVGRRQFRFR